MPTCGHHVSYPSRKHFVSNHKTKSCIYNWFFILKFLFSKTNIKKFTEFFCLLNLMCATVVEFFASPLYVRWYRPTFNKQRFVSLRRYLLNFRSSRRIPQVLFSQNADFRIERIWGRCQMFPTNAVEFFKRRFMLEK